MSTNEKIFNANVNNDTKSTPTKFYKKAFE